MISIIMLVRSEHKVIEDMTRNALESIRDNTEGDSPEVVLVRNGGRRLMLSPADVGLKGAFLNFQEGRPLSQAYNRGVEHSTGDRICIMHNDVVLPKGWNVPLEKASELRAIAFPMVDEEKSFCEQRGIKKTEPWQTTGACFMLSRGIWDELGGYDEKFIGFHWEDTDLFYRAHLAGVRLIRCPVTVVHHRGATRTFTKSEEGRYFENNMRYHEQKHGGAFVPSISEEPQEV